MLTYRRGCSLKRNPGNRASGMLPALAAGWNTGRIAKATYAQIVRKRGFRFPKPRRRNKKTLQVTLEDQQIIELMRILIDDDAAAGLVFLKTHFKGKARELLEGG